MAASIKFIHQHRRTPGRKITHKLLFTADDVIE